MPGRTRSSSKPSEPGDQTDRSLYQAVYAHGFQQALRHLGIEAEDTIAADLREFMNDYCRNMTMEDLRNVWDYKPLVGRMIRRWRVDQIRVATHYRIALTITHAVRRVWFLNAYRRHTDNSPDIDTAVTRARRIWGQYQ